MLQKVRFYFNSGVILVEFFEGNYRIYKGVGNSYFAFSVYNDSVLIDTKLRI
jgi:hypothetical protein